MEIELTRQSVAISVRLNHDVGDARRQAMLLAKNLNFDETASGRVGIVATELAGNLAKHAGGGTMILRVLSAAKDYGLEIMSIDDGPGMNVQRCLEDGYSTAGSPGTGLGAVSRMATHLDIYSLRDKGTVIVAHLWASVAPVNMFDVGAICLPIVGEDRCGDGWAVRESTTGLEMVVSDGLGHGHLAAEATNLVLETFAKKSDIGVTALLELMHGALRSTRGAAVLTLSLDISKNLLSGAGVGNIAGYVITTPKSKGIVSMNGIVGHQVTRVKSFDYECAPDDLLILHSDGLTTHWKLDDFPGLITRSSSLIAGMLYKNFSRGRDDSTVVVVRRQ